MRLRRFRDEETVDATHCERCGDRRSDLVVIDGEPICGSCIDLRELDLDDWVGLDE